MTEIPKPPPLEPTGPDPFIASDPFWGGVENFRLARVACVALGITIALLPVLIVLALHKR